MHMNTKRRSEYSEACVKRPLSKRPKMVLKTNCRLMQVKSIAECSKGSILQYFRPSLSYQLLLRSLFCLFLSARFTQVLLCRNFIPLFPRKVHYMYFSLKKTLYEDQTLLPDAKALKAVDL